MKGARQNENVELQKLRRAAAVPQCGVGGEGAGRIAIQRLRAHARARLPGAQNRQPNGGAEGKVREVGGAAHEGWWERLKAQWGYNPNQNSFPLPHEVFELGLEQGVLLVYVYLVHHKSLKHSPAMLSCAIVSKAVGLCEKTVRRHLHALVNQGLIQAADCGRVFSYSLCPIWDKVQERRSKDLFSECEGGRSA